MGSGSCRSSPGSRARLGCSRAACRRALGRHHNAREAGTAGIAAVRLDPAIELV
jgi:hypothetical protein